MNATPPNTSLRMIDGVGIVACLAVTALAFVLGVQPMLEKSTAARQLRTQLAAERARANEAYDSLAMLREQVVVIEQAVDQSPLQLKPARQLNARLSLITATAAEAGVEVDRLEPGQPLPHAHYLTVPIRVSGRSGYPNLTRFLSAIHQAAPDTTVVSLDLRGQPRTPDTPAMFDLALQWHAAP